MKKNILIITGSPRAKGNTNSLASAFASGAMAAGNKVEFFNAATCNMNGCHADQSCFERGYCGQKDDGVKMHKLMSWADVLVLASPVYWKGFTSQMKTVIDRFYQYLSPKGRATCSVKETYLISAAMMPDEEAFTCMREEYEHVNVMLGFENKGELLVSGLEGTDALVNRTEEIEKAVIMGYHV